MNELVCIWLATLSFAVGASDGQSGPEQAVREQLRTAMDQQTASMKSIFVNFWDRDFRKYELHGVIHTLIQKIDEDEMLKFLQNRGVPLTPDKILTAENLIAYWQQKKIGTQAAWAWLDLTKGNPDFVRAVMDWNVIQQERGFEFVPMFYLLFKARLDTQRDWEVWADLFKARFVTFGEQDTDKKMLLLFCCFAHMPPDLKGMDPPLVERFAFLVEELRRQKDISKPYPQALSFALFVVNFGTKHFNEAAEYAERLGHPANGLHLAFIARVLAKDRDAATATLSKLEKLAPENKKMLDKCHVLLGELNRVIEKENSEKAPEPEP